MHTIKLPSFPDQSSLPKEPKSSRTSFWHRDLPAPNPLTAPLRQQLFHTLGLLLEAGLGLLDSLEILQDQFKAARMRAMLVQIHHDLAAGASFSEALSNQPRYFSSFEIFSLRMGEETGQLGAMMAGLARYYQKRVALRRKLVQAFSYPVVVIVIAMLVMAFMIGFVVPMFEDIFSRFDAQLPALTQQILLISAGLTQHGWKVGLGMAGLIGAARLMRKSPAWRRFWSQIGLALPGLGTLWLNLHLARFCYSFALLLKARVNLDQALLLLGQVSSFLPLQEALGQVHQAVLKGDSLYDAIAAAGTFPIFFRQMIKVGEQTATLDQIFAQMARTLEEKSDTQLAQLTRFLEPVLILLLGGMVAVILVAMYLPMFELSNAVG